MPLFRVIGILHSKTIGTRNGDWSNQDWSLTKSIPTGVRDREMHEVKLQEPLRFAQPSLLPTPAETPCWLLPDV